jgi:hypothetical protein
MNNDNEYITILVNQTYSEWYQPYPYPIKYELKILRTCDLKYLKKCIIDKDPFASITTMSLKNNIPHKTKLISLNDNRITIDKLGIVNNVTIQIESN